MTDINGMYNALLSELLAINSSDNNNDRFNQMTNLVQMLYEVTTISIAVIAGGILLRAKDEKTVNSIDTLLAAVRELEAASIASFSSKLRARILAFAVDNQTPDPFSNPEEPDKLH